LVRTICVEDVVAPPIRQKRDVAPGPMRRGVVNHLDPVSNLRQMRNNDVPRGVRHGDENINRVNNGSYSIPPKVVQKPLAEVEKPIRPSPHSFQQPTLASSLLMPYRGETIFGTVLNTLPTI